MVEWNTFAIVYMINFKLDKPLAHLLTSKVAIVPF